MRKKVSSSPVILGQYYSRMHMRTTILVVIREVSVVLLRRGFKVLNTAVLSRVGSRTMHPDSRNGKVTIVGGNM